MFKKKCPICENDKSKIIKRIESFPLYQGTLSIKDLKKFKIKNYQMIWLSCINCSSIFLKKIPPLKYIYYKGHASGYGQIWNEHYKKFSNFISKNKLNGKTIDIGGGTGLLAKEILNKNKNLEINILEPAPSKEIESVKNIKLIKKNANFLYKKAKFFDNFIFSHSLEHITDLNFFLDRFSQNIRLGSKVFISWPNQEDWITKSVPGTINFEHSYFVNIVNIKILLISKGFELINEEKFQDHSFFMTYKKKYIKEKVKGIKFKNYLNKNNRNFLLFFNKFEKLKEKIIRLNLDLSDAYLMPASIYSQYIHYYLRGIINFRGIIDNSKNKQCNLLFGTNCKVYSNQRLKNKKNILVLLSGGFHTKEIKKSLKVINKNIIIIDTRKLLNEKDY